MAAGLAEAIDYFSLTCPTSDTLYAVNFIDIVLYIFLLKKKKNTSRLRWCIADRYSCCSSYSFARLLSREIHQHLASREAITHVRAAGVLTDLRSPALNPPGRTGQALMNPLSASPHSRVAPLEHVNNHKAPVVLIYNV